MDKVSICVHGGAGDHKNIDRLNKKAESVCSKGLDELKNGEEAINVVENAVNSLEIDPKFNAGKGSKLDIDGIPRTEAGIMNCNRDIGSVVGLERIQRPVSVARIILENINNNMLGSPYSNEFAKQHGFKKHNLVTRERYEQWYNLKKQLDDNKPIYLQLEEMNKLDNNHNHGTVGCVACDKNGNLCAATSTGGRIYQGPNRIGDSPLVGSGFICTENIAVSTTGVGEAIMKTQLARSVSEYYQKDNKLKTALEKALDELSTITDGHAGIIAVDKDNWAVDHNSTNMAYYGMKN